MIFAHQHPSYSLCECWDTVRCNKWKPERARRTVDVQTRALSYSLNGYISIVSMLKRIPAVARRSKCWMVYIHVCLYCMLRAIWGDTIVLWRASIRPDWHRQIALSDWQWVSPVKSTGEDGNGVTVWDHSSGWEVGLSSGRGCALRE